LEGLFGQVFLFFFSLSLTSSCYGRYLYGTLGGYILRDFLFEHPYLVKDKYIVEVGSGTGIVGLAAGALGASSVILTEKMTTDMSKIIYESDGSINECPVFSDVLLNLLQQNIDNNAHIFQNIGVNVEVMELSWTNQLHIKNIIKKMEGRDKETVDKNSIDLVLGSDVTFSQNSLPLLFSTVRSLFSSSSSIPRFIFSHQLRKGASTIQDIQFAADRVGMNSFKQLDEKKINKSVLEGTGAGIPEEDEILVGVYECSQ